MFNDNENIKNYFVYEYHHLDDLSAIQKISEVYRHFNDFGGKQNKEATEKTVGEVKKLFLKNGWEGDGEIGVIWIPPFVDIGHFEDTWGSYLWHVKQSNNGTSFIASPFPINQKRLKDQNEFTTPNHHRNMSLLTSFKTLANDL